MVVLILYLVKATHTMFKTLELNRRRFVQMTGITLGVGGVTTQPTDATDTEAPPVDAGSVFDHLEEAAISAFARDLESGETLLDSGSRRPVPLASTAKVVTTAAAFDALGPDYRYETTVGILEDHNAPGQVESLGIIASGDPDLTADDLRDLAGTVATHVDRVRGPIVVDVSVFDDGEHGPAWTVGDTTAAYGAKSSALMVDRNQVTVTVTRDGDDCELEVDLEPDSGLFDVENTLECVDDDRFVTIGTSDHWTNTVEIAGRIEPDDEATAAVPVGTPNEHAAAVFARALENEGVEFNTRGEGRPEITLATEPLELADSLATHESRSLSAITDDLNDWSYNMVAENVARTVSYEEAGTGTWLNWEDQLATRLADAGAETAQLRDGSGLSRHNLASARDVVAMIEWGLDHEWGETFQETIPIAGEEGTVRNRLGDVEATIRAKSGSLRGVTCLAGVVEADDGTPVTSFAVLAANLTGERATGASPRVDELVTAIADASATDLA